MCVCVRLPRCERTCWLQEENSDLRELLRTPAFARDSLVVRLTAQLPSRALPNHVALVSGAAADVSGVLGDARPTELGLESLFSSGARFDAKDAPFRRGLTGAVAWQDLLLSHLPPLVGFGVGPKAKTHAQAIVTPQTRTHAQSRAAAGEGMCGSGCGAQAADESRVAITKYALAAAVPGAVCCGPWRCALCCALCGTDWRPAWMGGRRGRARELERSTTQTTSPWRNC